MKPWRMRRLLAYEQPALWHLERERIGGSYFTACGMRYGIAGSAVLYRVPAGACARCLAAKPVPNRKRRALSAKLRRNPFMPEDKRLLVAGRLWQLQRDRTLLVWINGDRIQIAPFDDPECKRCLSWQEADRMTSPDLLPLTDQPVTA